MAEDTGGETPRAPATPPAPAPAPAATAEGDSDPDFDDLDDVLDQFAAAGAQSKKEAKTQPQQPTPSASGPGRPSSTGKAMSDPLPSSEDQVEESEGEFMARLTSVLGNVQPDPNASPAWTEATAKMDKELKELTSAMEKQGIKPEDLLKAILGDGGADMAGQDAGQPPRPEDKTGSSSTSTGPTANQPSTTQSTESSSSEGTKATSSATSFESSLRRTMERMQASDSHATTAANTQSSGNDPSSSSAEDEMLATLLKAMETSNSSTSTDHPTSSSPGVQGQGQDQDQNDPLSNLFLSMMHQLTTKEVLYEPMKELDSKFPSWLSQHKPASPAPQAPKGERTDYDRYQAQSVVVRDMVTCFEGKGYSDDDPRCRQLIWEKMQLMQGLGSPPEDLIGNPLGGLMEGLGRSGGDEVGECPTQ